MSRPTHKCSVVGCASQHSSVFTLPASEAVKTCWIVFIFNGNVPTRIPKTLYVCGHHFSSDCFLNEGQFKAGFAARLKIKDGSIPTIRDPNSDVKPAITSEQLPATKSVACQTDPPQLHAVGTQLSLRTLGPHFRSEAVQATVSCKDFGTSTLPPAAPGSIIASTSLKTRSKRPRLDPEEGDASFERSSSLTAPEGLDTTCDPADSVTALSESTDMSGIISRSSHNTRKYIVYENCIMELFKVCPACQRASDVRSRRLGTFIAVDQVCPHCQFSRHWESQPVLGSTPAGNLQLSAAVYISGASFFTIEMIFKAMHLQVFQYDSFCRHARMYIEPAIIYKWRTSQDVMLQQLSEKEKIIVGGDMRADSSGHSAKFGSYTMMDLKTNTVVDVQLVQNNEVSGRYHMEKEGLQRSLAVLDARGVRLECIITKRHPQIQKYLRERTITQFIDVWHIEKGISKQLQKISKMRGCDKLGKWIRSIQNHIYWTAASSSSGSERVAKWTSVLNHVQDVHVHKDPRFPKCLHPLRQTRDKSKWLTAGTQAFYKLQKVLTNKRLLKAVEKLSPHHQTPSLEAFHSVILRFAPKNIVFSFIGMLCRLYLAALHYNENSARQQAATSAGDPVYKVRFSEGRGGEGRAKPVKKEPTFRYAEDLMDLIFEKVFVDPTPYTEEVRKIPIPPDLSSETREIASSVSRFSLGVAV